MTGRRVWLRWFIRACAAYLGVGFLVWILAIVRDPGAFGPIEWLITLFWYLVAWPVYVPLLVKP
jgi:hypothetical protein